MILHIYHKFIIIIIHRSRLQVTIEYTGETRYYIQKSAV